MNQLKLIVLPYKEGSAGAKMLAESIGCERVFKEQNFVPQEPTVVLNWGRGDWPVWDKNVVRYINPPNAVHRSINKIESFKAFQRMGVPCAPFTTELDVAAGWSRAGHVVFCRGLVEGKNAEGMVIAHGPEEVERAPLYTQNVFKGNEYRVHVMNGECFYANIKRKKAKERMPANASPLVRSGSHGWFFAHMDGLPSKVVCDAAVAATEALGLDFAGVDVAETVNRKAVVFEVNTAPEMGPNTTHAYKQALKKHYGNYKNNENKLLAVV